ncbi:hypothetical protein [Tomitella fengzijianii]|uniref:hypothetical protein n=1 Tax=Tomitella fengzijianii TaxID=2597660 RepID=UPI00131DC893|nr:hypothetical protein [Tomitella fengzijianii]
MLVFIALAARSALRGRIGANRIGSGDPGVAELEAVDLGEGDPGEGDPGVGTAGTHDIGVYRPGGPAPGIGGSGTTDSRMNASESNGRGDYADRMRAPDPIDPTRGGR